MSLATAFPRELRAPKERRQGRRLSVLHAFVLCDVGEANGGLVLDISPHGFAVQATARLPRSGALDFEITFPGAPGPIRGEAKVIWVEGTRAGLKIAEMQPEALAQLEESLAKLSSSQAPQFKEIFPVAVAAAEGSELADDAAKPLIAGLENTLLESPPETLQKLSEAILSLCNAGGVAIALGQGEEIVCVAGSGAAPARGAVVNQTTGLAAECLRSRQIIYCADAEADHRIDSAVARRMNIRSVLVVPLLSASPMRASGLLQIFSSSPHALEPAKYLPAIANALAGAGCQDSVQSAALGSKISAGSVGRFSARHGDPIAAEKSEPRAKAPPLQPSGFAPSGIAKHMPHLRWRSLAGRRPALIAAGVLLLLGAGATARLFHARSAVVASAKPEVVADQPAAGVPAIAAPSESKPAQRHTPRTLSRRAPKPLVEDSGASAPAIEVAPPSQRLPDSRTPTPAPPLLMANADAAGFGAVATAIPPEKPILATPASVAVPARLMHQVDPIYPPEARSKSATVILDVTIGANGRVGNIHPVRSDDPAFLKAAVAAVSKWRYAPAQLDGHAIATSRLITINFK